MTRNTLSAKCVYRTLGSVMFVLQTRGIKSLNPRPRKTILARTPSLVSSDRQPKLRHSLSCAMSRISPFIWYNENQVRIPSRL